MGLLAVILTVAVVQIDRVSAQDLITFDPEVKYVKPGAEFELVCETDSDGVVEEIYSPGDLPPERTLNLLSQEQRSKSFTHAGGEYTKTYVDAAKEVHEGFYTCVVYRQTEPFVVQATRQVIIEDLCEDVVCPELKTCVADYDSGTSECQCVFNCKKEGLTPFDFLCTDTCETVAGECEMQLRNCRDGRDRKVWQTGWFCPHPVGGFPKPVVRTSESRQLIEPEVGEPVILDSGIIVDGTPLSDVTWTVNGVEDPEFRGIHQYFFVATAGMNHVIECKIVHCRDEDSAIINSYFVYTDEEPTTVPATSSSFTDTTPLPGGVGTTIYHVCSVFPGGAIEQFNTAAAFYDLTCTHVLAADFSPGGDYSQAWFVYGTFDQHDGNTALSALTIFAGRTAFEFQRGWLVIQNGEKVGLKEGEPELLGDCIVTFIFLHLVAECPHFNVYYDGVISGHIRLGSAGKTNLPPQKDPYSDAGLCWDNESGFRPNWQVNSNSGCTVDVTHEECSDSSECEKFNMPSGELSLTPWVFRGLGAHQSCNELHCEGQTPTAAQKCALEQAHAVNLVLRTQISLSKRVATEECPEEECDWKLDLLSRGCPQENPPFQC